MKKRAFAAVLLAGFAAACGNTSSMGPTGPTAQTSAAKFMSDVLLAKFAISPRVGP